jgi:hypothetical protein
VVLAGSPGVGALVAAAAASGVVVVSGPSLVAMRPIHHMLSFLVNGLGRASPGL